ncbi:helix-turn-helix transcriptional regulator [Devriesea agamarum]|uniref:helix-turn-helix transcriptional regulator n=1 Tax=Devriesea agamarum TaxID=472569 RepID=UPI00071CE5E2|nr:helix-turn-helix transcriptional regulator [Devriesea agamarum]
MGEKPLHPDGPVTELGEFLRARRDRITPDDVGINSYGRRRVPGLRREELAQLAGVSVTYLTRIEQGQAANASEQVIDALARALRLDADERTHLYTLAHPTPPSHPQPSTLEVAKPGAEQLLRSMHEIPAVLLGRFNDILAWNQAGHRLIAEHLDFGAPSRPEDRPNQLTLLFLDEQTRQLYVDWKDEAALAVASLRYAAAHCADDRRLVELVGELSMKSPEFATLWAGHGVRLCTSGSKRFRHPRVGDLELRYEVLHLPEGNGQRILTHIADPGSASYAALKVLTTTL